MGLVVAGISSVLELFIPTPEEEAERERLAKERKEEAEKGGGCLMIIAAGFWTAAKGAEFLG